MTMVETTVKPVLMGHSKRTPKLVFNTNYGLMQVKSIAECSKGSILQYFGPSLSYDLCFVYFEWPLKTGFTVSKVSTCLIHIASFSKFMICLLSCLFKTGACLNKFNCISKG